MSWSFSTLAPLAIFAATYLLISLQKIRFVNLDRASACLLGALLMVAVGAVSLDRAYAVISFDTLALLLGMMIIVDDLKRAGFFEWVSTRIILAAGTPERLLWLLILVSGLLSALFVNDTICLLFTPIVLDAVLRAKLNPLPYLVALVTSANIGSVATLTGNPQNMLIGIYSKMPYGSFLLYMAPVALVGLLLDGLILSRLYRGRLGAAFSLEGLSPPPVDRPALARIGAILALVLAGFLLPIHEWIPGLERGQDLPFSALAGAALVILTGRHAPGRMLASVDWPLLLFFASLFVVIEGINASGLLAAAHRAIEPFFGPTPGSQARALAGFSLVMSNVVSNVPYVAVAREWMNHFACPALMWCVLAMASTFAGNLTIVGSVANMIVMEMSKDRARVGFGEFLKAGVPVTLATTAAGTGLLLAMHAAGLF